MASAGASPNRAPERREIRSVNPSTRASRWTSVVRGSASPVIPSTAPLPSAASTTPRAPPSTPSTMLSVSSCCTTRPRPAPRAVRTANSRALALHRARVRFATFTQAMRSTKATAAMRRRSTGRTGPDDLLLQGDERGTGSLVRLWIRLGQSPADGVQVTLRLGERDARLQPRDAVDAQPRTPRQEEVVRPLPDGDVDLGDPGKVGRREGETGDDTHDGVRAAIESQCAADGLAARPEPALPQPGADQHHRGSTDLILAARECPPEHRTHPEQREEVRGDEGSHHLLRRALPGDDEAGVPGDPELGEDGVGGPPVPEVREGDGPPGEVGLGRVDPDEAVRIGEGERAEQHPVDQREERGVGAHPEGDGEHRHRREARRLAKASQRVPEIVEETHRRPVAATPVPRMAAFQPFSAGEASSRGPPDAVQLRDRDSHDSRGWLTPAAAAPGRSPQPEHRFSPGASIRVGSSRQER